MTSAKCAMITLSSFKWSLNVAIDEMQIFVPSFPASPGQTIATYQNNTSKHCLSNISKLQPNDRDISQHCPMLSATCCMRLATLLRCVGCCWLKFGHFQTWANNTQHVATHRNRVAKRTQHVAPNNVAICCVGMLRSFGRGLKLPKLERRGVSDGQIVWEASENKKWNAEH